MENRLDGLPFRGESRWNESRNDLGSLTIGSIRARKKHRGLFIREDLVATYLRVITYCRKPLIISSMAKKPKTKSVTSNVALLKNASERMNWKSKPINSKNWCTYLSQLHIWTRIRTVIADSVRQGTIVSTQSNSLSLTLSIYRFLFCSQLNKTNSSRGRSTPRKDFRVRVTVSMVFFCHQLSDH